MDEHDQGPDPDEAFDLDDWIDGTQRPAESVTLYARGDLNERLRQVEVDLAMARKVPPDQRGISDPTPDSLQAQWEQVAKELTASGLAVRVQALTSPEIKAARKAADAQVKGDDTAWMVYVAAAGTVAPRFTADQLMRLRERGGEAGVAALYATVLRLSNETPRPGVPSSPGPWPGTRA